MSVTHRVWHEIDRVKNSKTVARVTPAAAAAAATVTATVTV